MTHELPYLISETHPLASFHRDAPSENDLSFEEQLRQYGQFKLSVPHSPRTFAAGSCVDYTLDFTVGSLGLDEDGGLRLSFRFVSDMGRPQFTNPTAPNYVSVSTNSDARIELDYAKKGRSRPFQRSIFIHVRDHSMREGDTLSLRIGDTSAGSCGFQLQSFVEDPAPMRLAVDPFGTHAYKEYSRDMGFKIVNGNLHRYVICADSQAAAGETFVVKVKGEDMWGNPYLQLADSAQDLTVLTGDNAPIHIQGQAKDGIWYYLVSVADIGDTHFSIDGAIPSICNHVLISDSVDSQHQYYWADLHGQSGETVGCGTVDQYFSFAKTFGFLDVCTPQHNDFQINESTWEKIKTAVNVHHDDHSFVTFHGYEWSGNFTMGGDHNVIYLEDNPPLYRSHGWLVDHPHEETAPLCKLYDTLKNHKAMTIPHIGGRPASLEEMDPRIERVVELHSAWGTFEWVYEKCFEKGFKVGFVSNSDGHKCRPGASYPGAGIFGTLGGLTCIIAPQLSRESIWDGIYDRHCYATTGQRIGVWAYANDQLIGSDIATDHAAFKMKVLGTSPITAIDLMRKDQSIHSFELNNSTNPNMVVIRFGGSRTYGRSRIVPWTGKIRVVGNTLKDVTFNGTYNPNHGIEYYNSNEASFQCITSGNTMNLCITLTDGLRGRLIFESNEVNTQINIMDIQEQPHVFFDAPVDRVAEVFCVDTNAISCFHDVSYDLPIDHDDEVPYFFRIRQLDEGRAWTSPFYIKKADA